MTWLEHHRVSEQLSADAEAQLRAGDRDRARDLYAQAAEAETAALDDLDRTKSRTLGISVVSAVSLFFKADDLKRAEEVAFVWLGTGELPAHATNDLRVLLQSIWSEQVRKDAGVSFAPGQVLISVKGGEVVEGGAPLDLILGKVQVVQALFYRTAEFLRDLPHRRHGPPSKEIQDTCRPWLFQTVPGSYQFAVAVQEPRQSDMFKTDLPAPKEVADHFLQILRAGIDDPEVELPKLVEDREYQGTFLKLTRNLAPSGKAFERLEVKASGDSRAIRLEPETRKIVNAALKKARSSDEPTTANEESLTGILRAVHLDKDWLEVTVGEEHVRVSEVGETVDDVIGPMVNKPVIVNVLVDKAGKRKFIDIEPEN